MKYALALFFVFLASCTRDCPNDGFCPTGTRCVHYAFVGEQGSACLVLCDAGTCPAGQGQCSSCPESNMRCTLDDRTPSGGMCCVQGSRCL